MDKSEEVNVSFFQLRLAMEFVTLFKQLLRTKIEKNWPFSCLTYYLQVNRSISISLDSASQSLPLGDLNVLS